jgi:serine/threonine-protein kinase
MTPERWRLVRELMAAVEELPVAERARYLRERSGEDETLRADVESLLAAGEDAGSFLEAGALAGTLPQLAPSEAPAPRQRIGAYAVRREIGHGGMGTVYLGERAEGGFAKQVAIKVIRPGMDSEAVRQRFLSERQILASLEHPLIARLYDGGTTADGLPYFVMEHIEGEALLDYCDRRRLATRARLRLFLQVCAAVQYAHQRLVVHRDLKPSNILVTAEGSPKLLDFGLARVLTPPGGEPQEATALGLRPMTPEYASPEQVRGERVTTASDVYSLGVVLYELLTGRRPYRLRSRRAEEVERAVCGEQPERPSAAVTAAEEEPPGDGEPTSTGSPQARSESRDATPARLRRTLAGDLDTIVLAALRKEPERRYASVDELADDLRRYLGNMPVRARPDSAWYRGGKFVRRHTLPLAAAAAMLAVVATLTALYTTRLAQERDRARLEAEKARQVSTFLTSVFELADPDRAMGARLSARDLLDRSAARVEGELREQPEVQAAMMGLVGAVYRQLNAFDRARPLLQRALARREDLFGPDSLEVALSLRDLATLLHDEGEEAEARLLLRRALAIQEERLGAEAPEVARTLFVLATVASGNADYAEAKQLYRRALAIFARTPDRDYARALSNYGVLFDRAGEPAQALPYLARAAAIENATGGAATPRMVTILLNTGSVLRQLRRHDEAIATLERALGVADATVGRGHTFTAGVLNELATTRLAMGDRERAGPLYAESLAAYEAAVGADGEQAMAAVRNLAIFHFEGGELATALPLFERARAGRERTLGPDHPQVATGLLDVADLRAKMGEVAGVEPQMRRGVEILRHRVPPSHWRLGDGLSVLGGFLCTHQQADEGRALLTEAHGILQAAVPAEDPGLLEVAAKLRDCGGSPAPADRAAG